MQYLCGKKGILVDNQDKKDYFRNAFYGNQTQEQKDEIPNVLNKNKQDYFREAFYGNEKPKSTEKEDKKFSWRRFLGEHLAKGTFGLGDIAQFVSGDGKNIMGPEKTYGKDVEFTGKLKNGKPEFELTEKP